MKKAMCILMLIALLSALCGCSENKTLFEIQPFRCNVQISCGEENTEGVFVYENENSMYFDFDNDEYIGGMRVHYRNGTYDFICDGVIVNTAYNSGNVPLYGLFEAVELLGESQTEIKNGTENVFSLRNGYREYSYVIESENGRLIRIKSETAEIIFRY
ncbi:MAG: hypothetical protein IKY78_10670 [Clostridia bacterium]|nr:hypothetical protein [Clostridia bacterium]